MEVAMGLGLALILGTSFLVSYCRRTLTPEESWKILSEWGKRTSSELNGNSQSLGGRNVR